MRALTAAVLGWILMGSAPAGAADPDPRLPGTGIERWIHELRLGVMAHDVDALWSGQHKERGVDYGMELVFAPRVQAFSGVIRPNVGFDWHNRGDTSKAYAGAVCQWSTDWGLSFEVGLGAAAHTGERETSDPHRKQLGSKLLFRIPLELGLAVTDRQRVSLFFEHVSNAWLADENEGMDLLGMRWGFRF